MGFQGNLKSLSFPDLLQLLTMGKKTGTLKVSHKEKLKEIYFKQGRIIYAKSSTPEDMLENILLKKGKITREELAKSKQVQQITGKGLPSTLVYLNLMPKEEVSELVRSQVEEIVFSLFSWDEGDFSFDDGKLPDTDYMVMALNTMNILMEGTRRIDEWSRIRKNLPPENTVLRMVPAVFSQQTEIRLTPEEAQVLSFIDGERSIEEIKEKSPADELSTAKAIYSLLMSGFVQKMGVKESKAKVKAEEGELLELVVKLYTRTADVIKNTLDAKLGKATSKIVNKCFKKVQKRYPIINNLNIDSDGNIDFTNFIELVKKLPKENRIHEISSGLSSFFEELISNSYSLLGVRIKDQILEKIKEQTTDTINENMDALMRSGIYTDFIRLLQL